MARTARPDGVALTALLLASLFGGTNFVAVVFSNRDLSPFFGAGIRFLLAAVLLFAIAAVRRISLPRGPALTGALIYGVLSFGGFYASLYYALQRVPPGIASTTLASVPLATLLFAVAQRQERFSTRGVAGAVLAVAGIAVMVGGPGEGTLHLPSMAVLFVAVICVAEASMILKRFPGSEPVGTNAVAMVAGAALLLALAAALGEPFKLPTRTVTWVAVGYLIAVGSVALFMLYIVGLNRWTASGMSYQFVLIPVVAVLMSAWLLDQPVSLAVALGGLLVLAGTYVGVLSGKRPPVEEVVAPG